MIFFLILIFLAAFLPSLVLSSSMDDKETRYKNFTGAHWNVICPSGIAQYADGYFHKNRIEQLHNATHFLKCDNDGRVFIIRDWENNVFNFGFDGMRFYWNQNQSRLVLNSNSSNFLSIGVLNKKPHIEKDTVCGTKKNIYTTLSNYVLIVENITITTANITYEESNEIWDINEFNSKNKVSRVYFDQISNLTIHWAPGKPSKNDNFLALSFKTAKVLFLGVPPCYKDQNSNKTCFYEFESDILRGQMLNELYLKRQTQPESNIAKISSVIDNNTPLKGNSPGDNVNAAGSDLNGIVITTQTPPKIVNNAVKPALNQKKIEYYSVLTNEADLKANEKTKPSWKVTNNEKNQNLNQKIKKDGDLNVVPGLKDNNGKVKPPNENQNNGKSLKISNILYWAIIYLLTFL